MNNTVIVDKASMRGGSAPAPQASASLNLKGVREPFVPAPRGWNTIEYFSTQTMCVLL